MTSAIEEEAAVAIGRTRTVRDVPDALSSMRLLDLLGHDDARIERGDALPPLAHWMHFGGVEPLRGQGADGHPARGDFLPALPRLPRRMWAGGEVTFHAPLRAGNPATRRSIVEDVTLKEGRSGPLAFAVLRHEIVDADGSPLVTEKQTLVFREAADGKASLAESAGGQRPNGTWHRVVQPDIVTLFRYSALTFNSHRIHYDADYVRDVEGYRAPVIHGPLTATLLLDLAARAAPERTISRFSFSARAPVMLGDAIALDGEPTGQLVASVEGRTAMEARFELDD